ncbi:MAG: hypothetical protein QOG53_1597 [Frankiales bacterium]|nr:hypothetical protein [Frankiales bacterium]
MTTNARKEQLGPCQFCDAQWTRNRAPGPKPTHCEKSACVQAAERLKKQDQRAKRSGHLAVVDLRWPPENASVQQQVEAAINELHVVAGRVALAEAGGQIDWKNAYEQLLARVAGVLRELESASTQ